MTQERHPDLGPHPAPPAGTAAAPAPGAAPDHHPGTPGGPERRIEIACAALLRGDGIATEVLIARRRSDAVRGNLWELPGGKCDPGEDASGAAARELLEETAVTVQASAGRVLGRVEQDDPHMARERSIALTLVAFRAPMDAAPQAISSAECRWERVAMLDGYEWPAANARLNAMLAQALHERTLP